MSAESNLLMRNPVSQSGAPLADRKSRMGLHMGVGAQIIGGIALIMLIAVGVEIVTLAQLTQTVGQYETIARDDVTLSDNVRQISDGLSGSSAALRAVRAGDLAGVIEFTSQWSTFEPSVRRLQT